MEAAKAAATAHLTLHSTSIGSGSSSESKLLSTPSFTYSNGPVIEGQQQHTHPSAFISFQQQLHKMPLLQGVRAPQLLPSLPIPASRTNGASFVPGIHPQSSMFMLAAHHLQQQQQQQQQYQQYFHHQQQLAAALMPTSHRDICAICSDKASYST